MLGNASNLLPESLQSCQQAVSPPASQGALLSWEGMRATVDALRQFKTLMQSHGVTHHRCVATAAVREAANRDELLQAAEAILGERPRVLSGGPAWRHRHTVPCMAF